MRHVGRLEADWLLKQHGIIKTGGLITEAGFTRAPMETHHAVYRNSNVKTKQKKKKTLPIGAACVSLSERDISSFFKVDETQSAFYQKSWSS